MGPSDLPDCNFGLLLLASCSLISLSASSCPRKDDADEAGNGTWNLSNFGAAMTGEEWNGSSASSDAGLVARETPGSDCKTGLISVLRRADPGTPQIGGARRIGGLRRVGVPETAGDEARFSRTSIMFPKEGCAPSSTSSVMTDRGSSVETASEMSSRLACFLRLRLPGVTLSLLEARLRAMPPRCKSCDEIDNRRSLLGVRGDPGRAVGEVGRDGRLSILVRRWEAGEYEM